MKHIVDLAKNRGFVFQGSEIYGGLANTWDYGPLGSLLKENLKNLWIREFVQRRPDMVLLDAAILMNPNVWVASGHVGGFSDPLIDDKNTKERFRADKLIEEHIRKAVALKMDLLNDESKRSPEIKEQIEKMLQEKKGWNSEIEILKSVVESQICEEY